MTLYKYVAAAAWLILTLGLLNRQVRKRHIKLMLTGIALDVIVVLLLELNRSAIDTALTGTLDIFHKLHIGSSSVALLLYVPVLILGIKLSKGEEQFRVWHKRVAVSAYVFRTIGFVMMFTVSPISATPKKSIEPLVLGLQTSNLTLKP